jgi:hypothetical protein
MSRYLRRVLPPIVLAALGALLFAAPSRADDSPLADETLSVLNLNLEGTNPVYGPWRERYAEVARWMKDTGAAPDLLVLQEVPASKCWFASNCDPADYEAVFELLDGIRTTTGMTYRVALLSTGAPVEGWNPLYQGQAVLYNPARLRNVTPAPGGALPSGSITRSAEPHASYPCASPPAKSAGLCAMVDRAPDGLSWGPHWASEGVAFGRFGFVERADRAVVDVYDFHAPTIAGTDVPDLQLAAESVRRLERLAPPEAGARLIPPLLLGDFNNTIEFMGDEVAPGGRLGDFELLAYAPSPEVIGILEGRPTVFPARFAASVASNRFLPEATPEPCGPPRVRWSDHCAEYAVLSLRTIDNPATWTSVPDVLHETTAAATSALRTAGLAVSVKAQDDPTCNDVGAVVGETPPAGTRVATGATVTITIGKRPKTPCN